MLICRQIILMMIGIIFVGGIVCRLVLLQVANNEYLQSQGDARTVRTIPQVALRGLITDRHGEPLAVSTPVKSVWINPQEVNKQDPSWAKLAQLLGIKKAQIFQKIQQKQDKQFVYLKRQISPMLGKKIEGLHLSGVNLQSEYHRYYPTGEVVAHVIGTTNIDHRGIQGLELALDNELAGKSGHYQVLKDGLGMKVEDYHHKELARSGQDITLSLDNRIQYLAYRELMAAVKKHGAVSGSIVVLDAKTGEIMAMANQPSFNPNGQYQHIDSRFRNRAVTDQFEPGSVLKAFSVASILASGKFDPLTQVDTNPGWMKVSGKVVRDTRNFGVLDLNHMIQKSSNVGIAKLTLELPPQILYDTLRSVGFGQSTQSGFPGESSGFLPTKVTQSPFVLATLSFGYGLSVTPLQLAQAYGILANDGKKCPVTFLKKSKSQSRDLAQIIDPDVARSVNKMLQLSVTQEGTGYQARVPGYQVAGKTGTVKKVSQHGYYDNNHVGFFAGFAPANDPRLVIVVMIDEPKSGQYYGGQVAAPVFSRVMFGALRLLNVPQQSLQPV